MPAPRKVVKTTPDADLSAQSFEFQEKTFEVRTKYKIAKFFKALNENPIDALELVLTEDAYAEFEELEMDMEDFKIFMEKLAEAVGGSTGKN